MDETLIYGTLEYYISDLNTNNTYHPPPSTEEVRLLDKALMVAHNNPELAKQ